MTERSKERASQGPPADRGPVGGRSARTLPALGAALLAVLAVAVQGVAGSRTTQEAELPEAMKRLEALAGSWATDRVEFLDPDGEVRKVAGATARNELQLGGRVLAHGGRLDDPVIETRGWYWWSPEDGRLHMGSVTSRGRYDEFVGGWEGDRLVMTILPSEALGGRLFRMTHSEITEDSFLESMAMSEDGGETWRVTSRQRMWRVGTAGAADSEADARETLAAMDAYTGHWRSEDKTTQRGDTFHFEYDLWWMDPGRTIARVVIERVDPDGGRSTVFEGYKGREPSGEGVYYHGASPDGRGSRGEVFLEGADLVTLYDGWTVDGDVVEIRDVFEPVTDGSFTSRTFLRPSPDAEWRRIGEDDWTRVGPAVR